MSIEIPQPTALLERLRRFLEIHNQTRILEASQGNLRMHILHAKNTKKEKIKDKMINLFLARLDDLLFAEPSERDLVVCEFLIEELEKYVSTQLK